MRAMSVEQFRIENQPLRRYSRVEYDDLVRKGAFQEDRVELVFGQVVAMSPIDPVHVRSTHTLHRKLSHAIGRRATVFCQMPIAATQDSEPEPDIYVTPGEPSWNEHASRAYLVIEVANSSLAYDRTEKALLYSMAQVDEYWIVDLVNGLVEVRRERDAGVWRSISTYRRGDTVHMLAFPDVDIEVSEILPPA